VDISVENAAPDLEELLGDLTGVIGELVFKRLELIGDDHLVVAGDATGLDFVDDSLLTLSRDTVAVGLHLLGIGGDFVTDVDEIAEGAYGGRNAAAGVRKRTPRNRGRGIAAGKTRNFSRRISPFVVADVRCSVYCW